MKRICLLLTAVLVVVGISTGCTNNERVDATPLRAEELDYFNGDDFFNGPYMNIRNQFLSSLYDTPEKINLFELFYAYAGAGTYEPPSEQKAAAVIAANGWDREPDTACTKITRAAMDETLTRYMGLTLADTDKIGLEKFTYLEEYDAYYIYHGDTNYRMHISFSGGEKEGDLVRLFYNDDFFSDGEKALTLKMQGAGYLFVSNRPAEGDQSSSGK